MPEDNKIKYSKLMWLAVAFLLSIPLFFALAWMPVYHVVSGDVLMQDSIFLLFWDFLKDGLTYLFYWLSIVFFTVSLVFYGWKGGLPFFGFYLLGAVIRSIGTALSSAIILHAFDEDFAENIGFAALDVLFDLLLLGAFCLIAFLTLTRGRTKEARSALLPPAAKGFCPAPLHLSVLLSVAVYYTVRLFSRIRYDIFYGAASSGQDLAWMIFYYVADAALSVFGYFAVILILKKLTIPKKKK